LVGHALSQQIAVIFEKLEVKDKQVCQNSHKDLDKQSDGLVPALIQGVHRVNITHEGLFEGISLLRPLRKGSVYDGTLLLFLFLDLG
jgi:hypothetical protein